jgi:hypothetical protein
VIPITENQIPETPILTNDAEASSSASSGLFAPPKLNAQRFVDLPRVYQISAPKQ